MLITAMPDYLIKLSKNIDVNQAIESSIKFIIDSH